MILLLLEDLHGPDFKVEQLLDCQARLNSLQNGINNGFVVDLDP